MQKETSKSVDRSPILSDMETVPECLWRFVSFFLYQFKFMRIFQI